MRDVAAAAARPRALVARLATLVSLLAAAAWLGGLLALGAIAAPVVFSLVPFPSSADAMTVVFQRFDRVAMASAALLLAAEAARAVAGDRVARADHLRIAASTLAGALAVLQGLLLSPRIAALHQAGAIRGVGDDGLALSRFHDWAEWSGKVQLILLFAVLALHVFAPPAVAPSSRPIPRSG